MINMSTFLYVILIFFIKMECYSSNFSSFGGQMGSEGVIYPNDVFIVTSAMFDD
jgi:hypothetical protein